MSMKGCSDDQRIAQGLGGWMDRQEDRRTGPAPPGVSGPGLRNERAPCRWQGAFFWRRAGEASIMCQIGAASGMSSFRSLADAQPLTCGAQYSPPQTLFWWPLKANTLSSAATVLWPLVVAVDNVTIWLDGTLSNAILDLRWTLVLACTINAFASHDPKTIIDAH